MTSAIAFHPRLLLKQLSKPLLRHFFERRGELLDLPWPTLIAKNLSTPVFTAWQNLPEPRRSESQAILREIHDAASERGIAACIEQLRAFAPREAWALNVHGNRASRMLWLYLNHPRLFDQGTLFARADSLSAGRFAVRREDLPKTSLTPVPELSAALGAALRDFYWPTQMRGHHCHVEHLRRPDGDDYFFAYLDDWPDKQFEFGQNGRLRCRSARFAFSVLFIYSSVEGSLELIANGGESVQYPLQRAFCRSVLGTDVEPPPRNRPVYQLQAVLDPAFTYPTAVEDGVGRVQLKSIRFKPLGQIRKLRATVQVFDPTICRTEWLDLIRRGLAGFDVSPTQAIVEGATFRLTVRGAGGRARSLEFTVALPCRCTIHTQSEELAAIGKRCLRNWGMIHV